MHYVFVLSPPSKIHLTQWSKATTSVKVLKDEQSLSSPPPQQTQISVLVEMDSTLVKPKNTVVLTATLYISIMKNKTALTQELTNMKISELQLSPPLIIHLIYVEFPVFTYQVASTLSVLLSFTFEKSFDASHLFHHLCKFSVLGQKLLDISSRNTWTSCYSLDSSWLFTEYFGTIRTVKFCNYRKGKIKFCYWLQLVAEMKTTVLRI